RLCRGGSLGLRHLLGGRTGNEPLSCLVAINELDHRDPRRVAVAIAGPYHAGIAAGAVLVAPAHDVGELPDPCDIAHLGDRLPARVQIAALAERDQLLDDRAQVLRLRQGGDDLLVLDQRRRHVGEHGATMLGLAVELAVSVSVTHWANSRRRRNGGRIVRPPVSNDPRTAWRARRCSQAASPALPCRGGAPSARALP